MLKILTQRNINVCVNDKFTKPIFVFRGENPAYEFIKAILKEFETVKKY